MTAVDHVFKYADWQSPPDGSVSEFLKALCSGETFECDDEMYSYWLEVLPPIHMGKLVQLPNGETVNADFGFAEGAEEITVFWSTGKLGVVEKPEGGIVCSLHLAGDAGSRFFGCRTNRMNPFA